MLRLPEQASPEEVNRQRARAEGVLAQLRQGADFAKLAVAYSDAPDALQGGRWAGTRATGCRTCTPRRSTV